MKLKNNLTFENLLKNEQWTSQFNEAQLEELIDGYNSGVDAQVCADPRINEYFMYPLRHALEEYGNPQDSISVRKKIISYINDGYALYQFIELVRGLLNSIDVSCYEDPSLSSGIMQLIRHNLMRGIDVSEYAHQGFALDQLSQISQGLYLGLDVSHYANKEFTPRRMKVIRHGLEEGVDVSVYADPKLSADEMQRRLDELRRQSRITERTNDEIKE